MYYGVIVLLNIRGSSLPLRLGFFEEVLPPFCLIQEYICLWGQGRDVTDIRKTQAQKNQAGEEEGAMETGEYNYRGPVVINTVYLPPRRNGIPLAEIRREFQRNQAAYLFGDLNARHNALGYNSTNNTGQEIVNLMRNDICSFLGPDFNTLVIRHIRGHSDILLGNRNAVFCYRMYEGIITTSDHIPVILELSTQPFLM